jgi:glucose-6-phosphate isomerase
MTHTIHMDAVNFGADRVGEHGLDAEHLENLTHRIRGFRSRIAKERERGEHAYLNLPADTGTLEQVFRIAQPRLGRFDHLVVIGIGGSALGLRAIENALCFDGPPRPAVHVLDNTDPALFRRVLGRIEPARTLAVAVSKSGGTLETVLGLGALVELFRDRGLPLADHLLVVTDPESGPLRRFADNHGLMSADIPPGVGGRFSVLSAAGLLPAALLNVDVAALLAGAARTVGLSTQGPIEDDWPARLGLMAADLCRARGKSQLVFMPYSARLERVADWFVQLWDESLGKAGALDGSTVSAGQTAIRAVGATDQHSQLQLFLEGPNDKLLVFTRVEHHGPDMTAANFAFSDFGAAYVEGRTLAQVLHAQLEGTTEACTRRERPNATLRLPTLNAETLGELLMGLQIATTYAGLSFGINPYDQPSVELGKQISRQRLEAGQE